MGQLAPMGTGSFDMLLCQETLEKYATTECEQMELMGNNTPIFEDEYRFGEDYLLNGFMTSYQDRTPMRIKGATSEY